MRSDLFENYICKKCGNKDISKFERLEKIIEKDKVSVICACNVCDSAFILTYEKEAS